MKRIKPSADRDVIEFLDVEGLIGKISVEPVEQLKNYNRKVAALEHVDVLFLITEEIAAQKIADIVARLRIDRINQKPINPKHRNIDADMMIVSILREKFERHVKTYIVSGADTTTVIPYRCDQDAVIHSLLKTMIDEFNRDDRLLEFLQGSQNFAYRIGDRADNKALQYYGDHLELDGMTLYKPHPISLETEFGVKVIGVGKKHYVGKMRECIAYEDIDELETPSDIKRAIDFIDFPCLIVEFDDAHFKKAEAIARVRDGTPFVVFVPTESFVESELADVTIKVKPEAREKLVRDINRFEIGREDFFDPIGFATSNSFTSRSNAITIGIGSRRKKFASGSKQNCLRAANSSRRRFVIERLPKALRSICTCPSASGRAKNVGTNTIERAKGGGTNERRASADCVGGICFRGRREHNRSVEVHRANFLRRHTTIDVRLSTRARRERRRMLERGVRTHGGNIRDRDQSVDQRGRASTVVGNGRLDGKNFVRSRIGSRADRRAANAIRRRLDRRNFAAVFLSGAGLRRQRPGQCAATRLRLYGRHSHHRDSGGREVFDARAIGG